MGCHLIQSTAKQKNKTKQKQKDSINEKINGLNDFLKMILSLGKWNLIHCICKYKQFTYIEVFSVVAESSTYLIKPMEMIKTTLHCKVSQHNQIVESEQSQQRTCYIRKDKMTKDSDVFKG